ncbi:MAG TPA: hypothetical protein VKU00_04575 [Chthonomonadaceae bacterium]|nr:hypothetical protein [Chthonomonadaceae bacterium]
MRRSNCRAIYDYDEERSTLTIEYDRNSNQVTVRGGVNAYARLMELFDIYSNLKAATESDINQ